MSLKVWFPFSENTRNRGCDYVKITGGNFVLNNNGKLGKCLETSEAIITDVSTSMLDVYFTQGTELSYSVWLKVDKEYLNQKISTTDFSTRTQIYNKVIGLSSSTTSSGLSIHIRTEDNLTSSTELDQVQIIGYYRTGSSASGSTPMLINLDEWYHLAITYDKNNVFSFYIDGNLITKKVITRSKLNSSISTKTLRLNGAYTYLTTSQYATKHLMSLKEYFNDVRIYDHALSAAEVKEISQGLVLHYKLSDFIQPNLLKESNIVNSQAYNVASLIHYYFDSFEKLPSGTYTFSFDIKSSNGTDNCYVSYANNASTLNRIDSLVQIPAEWTHYSYTFTSTSTKCNNIFFANYTKYGSPHNSNNTGIIYVRNVKLEQGSIETPYCMAQSQGYYPYIYDSSGNNYNGKAIKSPQFTSDDNRYHACMSFNGTNQFINAYRNGMVKDSITINIWCCFNTQTQPNTLLVSCSQNGGWGIIPCSTATDTVAFYLASGNSFSSYQTLYSITPYDNLISNWHMITATYDGYDMKLYIDGILDNTLNVNSIKTPILYHASNSIILAAEAGAQANTVESNRYLNGKLSDFRIYATALSDADILALYNTRAKIDNLQNLHVNELVESTNTSPKILKNGQFITKELQENNNTKFYKSGIVETAQIIEV